MTNTNPLPKFEERMGLVHLSFSKPQQQKLDRKATADAENANGARGSLKTMRHLYPKKFFEPILSIENEARDYLRSHTIEMGDTGMYLMPYALAPEVLQRLSEYETKRSQEVAVFGQNLATILAEAQAQQGALFDPTVYPSVSEVTAQFRMSFTLLPMGNMGILTNAVAGLEQDLADAVKDHTEQSIRQSLASTVQPLLFRLVDSVINIFDKLSRDDSRIHDSLMGELEEITRMIPSLNVTGNPKLNQLAELCRRKLLAPVDHVKSDTAKRDRIAEDAKQIAQAMGVDTGKVSKPTTSERREIAKKAAENIAAQMKGFM